MMKKSSWYTAANSSLMISMWSFSSTFTPSDLRQTLGHYQIIKESDGSPMVNGTKKVENHLKNHISLVCIIHSHPVCHKEQIYGKGK